MKKSIFVVILLTGVAMTLGSCVNGKDKTGKPVNTDTLSKRDTVATLLPNESYFFIAEKMQKASFQGFFQAEVDEKGIVSCHFDKFDDPMFSTFFDKEKCPREKICIENASGRCRGVAILNEGGGVDPYLLMLMEDDHAERIQLYDLSTGTTRSTQRTAQEGITQFDMGESTDDGTPIVGVAIDGSKISLDWEAV
ncbi:MAG: hypothetical protein MJZ60_06160 [Bacteroidaceae bacterium]|nr:hypothetical protein [Bacteroidaceae bacterium]